MIISAGMAEGVGLTFASSTCCFVAGSQVGGFDGGAGISRRWRVRTCGIVLGVPRVFAK